MTEIMASVLFVPAVCFVIYLAVSPLARTVDELQRRIEMLEEKVEELQGHINDNIPMD